MANKTIFVLGMDGFNQAKLERFFGELDWCVTNHRACAAAWDLGLVPEFSIELKAPTSYQAESHHPTQSVTTNAFPRISKTQQFAHAPGSSSLEPKQQPHSCSQHGD